MTQFDELIVSGDVATSADPSGSSKGLWVWTIIIVILLSPAEIITIWIHRDSGSVVVLATMIAGILALVAFGVAVLVQWVWKRVVAIQVTGREFHKRVNWSALVVGATLKAAFYALNVLS